MGVDTPWRDRVAMQKTVPFSLESAYHIILEHSSRLCYPIRPHCCISSQGLLWWSSCFFCFFPVFRFLLVLCIVRVLSQCLILIAQGGVEVVDMDRDGNVAWG